MRAGMIILMVFGIIDVILLFINLINYATLSAEYPSLYWGQFGGTIPNLILNSIRVALIGKWLGSPDRAFDRILLIKAMRLGCAIAIYMMVYNLILIITSYNDFTEQARGQLIGGIIGGLIGLVLQIWYLQSARQFYAERYKSENGGQMI